MSKLKLALFLLKLRKKPINKYTIKKALADISGVLMVLFIVAFMVFIFY